MVVIEGVVGRRVTRKVVCRGDGAAAVAESRGGGRL